MHNPNKHQCGVNKLRGTDRPSDHYSLLPLSFPLRALPLWRYSRTSHSAQPTWCFLSPPTISLRKSPVLRISISHLCENWASTFPYLLSSIFYRRWQSSFFPSPLSALRSLAPMSSQTLALPYIYTYNLSLSLSLSLFFHLKKETLP